MATPAERLEKAFAVLDDNKDGFVTSDEISSVLAAKGITVDAGDLATAFKTLDKDGDGKLTFAEFSGVSQEPLRSKFLPLFDKLVA